MIFDNFILFENVQQAKSVLRKYNVPENDSEYLKIRNLLKDNLGYLGFFVKMWLEKEISFDSIKEFIEMMDKPYIPKNIISYTSWETLMDDVLRAKSEWKYKQILNEFPASQKNLINELTKPLLINLYDRKDKENYIKKIARYKTTKELNSSLKTFLNSDTDVRYNSLISKMNNKKIDLIYSNKDENIIIVKVDNSSQLNDIAGDSSWCILSQSTFDSYNNGLYRQYVVFLTDKDDNYRKIGITFGRKMKTAHLLNDESIYSTELSKILNERGFDLNDLQIPLDQIDFNKTNITDLVDAGFSKEDIINRKKTFKKNELNHFTKDEIEQYKLHDKIELNDISDLKDQSLTWIIDNLFRIKLRGYRRDNDDADKIGIDYIIGLNPLPREVNLIYTANEEDIKRNFKYNCIKFFEEIKKPINDIKFWYYKDDGNIEKMRLFVIKYKRVGPHNFGWEDVLEYFKDSYIGSIDNILNFLKYNGYDIDTEKLIELIQHFKFELSSFWHNPLNRWLELLIKFPELKDHVDKIVNLLKKGKINDFLLKNKITRISFIEVYPTYLEKYPDSDLKSLCDNADTLELYKKILPKQTVQNYDRLQISKLVKKISPEYTDISPKIIVDYFFPKIKNYLQKSEYGFENGLNLLYMIVSLVKTGNIDKLKELNLELRQKKLIMYIRIIFDLETYNHKEYLREDFRLSEKEREKLCEWFLQNKNIIRTNYGNELVDDMNMFQHHAVSLIYYYYDWGFQNYFKLVKNFKNQKDEWIKIDTQTHKKDGINRIDLFREIFNYLFKIKDKTSYDELVSNIKNSMILKQYELKQLEGSWKDYYGSSSDL